jgi:hypothetical protein
VPLLAHVAAGIGTRKTARLSEVHQDTVARCVRQAGDSARRLHDEWATFSPGDGRGPAR